MIEVNNNSAQDKYVQKASLNGVELTNLTFTHEQLKAGGVLAIEMGQNPVK
jgi:putative alpha-1,2-mannosidase